MNIQASGANQQKSKFFKEIATAFEFLAIFYQLDEEQQQELLQHITYLQAKKGS